MRQFSPGFLWVIVAAGLAIAAPAGAVIRVDFPVSKIYATSSTVLVGTVRKVTEANRVVDVRLAETAKGDPPGPMIRVQILKPERLIRQVAAGHPLVLFVAKGRGKAEAPSAALVHVADTWLLAKRLPKASAPSWRAEERFVGRQCFPGRTAALVKVVAELEAGKTTLLDKAEHNVFRGGVKPRGRLDVTGATFLAAADVDGDRKHDLLIAAPSGFRLLLADGEGFTDATAARGLSGAAGRRADAADVNGDGRVDLLVGATVWVNHGSKFAADARLDLPAGAVPLTVALADLTGDGRPDAAALLGDGRLLSLENPAAGKAWSARPARKLWTGGEAPACAAFGDWGDDGRPHVIAVRTRSVTRYALTGEAPPADYERLTGVKLDKYHRAHRDGLKNVLTAPIDINADGRRDLFILADGGGLMLVNRGFGTFLVNPDAGGAVTSRGRRKVPFKLTPTTPWTAADLHHDGFEDLLILTPSGDLYEVSNTPYGPRRPLPGRSLPK